LASRRLPRAFCRAVVAKLCRSLPSFAVGCRLPPSPVGANGRRIPLLTSLYYVITDCHRVLHRHQSVLTVTGWPLLGSATAWRPFSRHRESGLIRLSRTFGFAEAEGFPFRMGTAGVDWQPLTNHRAVANFCTAAPQRSCKTWHALQIWLRSRRTRRTLCLPVCTPAPLVKKHKGGRWPRWSFVGPPSHLPKYAKS
jgi:hypothetical protein